MTKIIFIYNAVDIKYTSIKKIKSYVYGGRLLLKKEVGENIDCTLISKTKIKIRKGVL